MRMGNICPPASHFVTTLDRGKRREGGTYEGADTEVYP